MATLLELQTRVLRYVIDAPPSVQTEAPMLLNEAMRTLQERNNFRVMEAKAEAITVAGQKLLMARPGDWKAARGKPYYVEELGRAVPMDITTDEREALKAFGNNPTLDFGAPTLIWEDEANSVLNVYPFPDGIADYSDGEYRVKVPYWKYLPDLSPSASNWFTNNAVQAVLYEAVALAFAINWDESRANFWQRRADKHAAIVINNDKRNQVQDTQEIAYHKGARGPHTTI